MKKTEEIKCKVKEATNEVKEVIVDNKGQFILYGVCIIIGLICIVLCKRDSKKHHLLWSAAKKAYENGDLNHDFGPYKVMKFFEPKTKEFIGETVVHENCMKAFLDIK